MHKSHAKRRRDIKNKLMAAICMLLVSSIMMVSSTYAWFTLSTAPEVTGIQTAVGANGNLEMALLPKDGLTSSITSAAGDSTKATEAKNVTWGNLVDLSNSTIYGLDKITLFPSALNAATSDDVGNPLTLAAALLKTPTYGADGRVSELVANTFTGYYDSGAGSFAPNDYYGVRAVGTSSGMTDRQLSYRNARSAANTAKALAATMASTSLEANGSALANIAIKHGMGGADESYGTADVAALRKIVDDLQDGVLKQIEKAYLQYILAFAASAAAGEDDTAWLAVKSLVEAENATLSSVVGSLSGVTLPEAVTTGINKYNQSVEAVEEADAALTTLETSGKETFTWEEISEAMTLLANPSAMKLNGYEVSQVKANLGSVVSSVTSMGGLVVTMATGGGVYADIADQSGDYTAGITIEKVDYNGITLENMEARMNTASTVVPSHLTAIGAAVEAASAPAGAASGTLPLSDMFGYVIDLAFRTNAADSNLLLQQEGVDRIYNDNTNEETMGHGSSMTFKSTDSATFNDNQVLGLMGAIRIVFFDAEMNVIATAKLDTANATMDENGWTAKMYLYTVTAGGTTTEYVQATYVVDTPADGETPATYKLADEGVPATHALINGAYVEATHVVDDATAGTYKEAATGATHAVKTVTSQAGENRRDDNIIMPLTQNTAHQLSMLVYLDGNVVGNDDVAATAATSMTGTMNLQFASSATLVPMDYADLYIPSANNGETPEENP